MSAKEFQKLAKQQNLSDAKGVSLKTYTHCLVRKETSKDCDPDSQRESFIYKLQWAFYSGIGRILGDVPNRFHFSLDTTFSLKKRSHL